MGRIKHKDKEALIQIFGCLLQQPILFLDEKYRFIKEDFPEFFYQSLFSAMEYLVKNGASELDYMAISNYLSGYPSAHKAFEKNGGVEYLANCSQVAQPSNFEYYYTKIKKLSLLNQLEEQGFQTTHIYDPSICDSDEYTKMQAKFDSYTLDDIFNIFDGTIINLKDIYSVNHGSTGCQAAQGMTELKEQYKEIPEMGMPMCSPKLTTIFRGRRLKKVYLKTAPSGFGKCIVGNSLIYTDEGLLEIEDIPNHYALNDNNELQSKVVSYDISNKAKHILPTSHWYNMGKSKTIKIRTFHGYEIEGTPEHPIVVRDKNRNILFKKLKDITKEDEAVISLNNNLFGPRNFDDNMAYTWGTLATDYQRRGRRGLMKVTLQANEASVKKFLQGLFDTDGILHSDCIEWIAPTTQMLKEVRLLLLNMGIVTMVSNVTRMYIIGYSMLKQFCNKVGFKPFTEKNQQLTTYLAKSAHCDNDTSDMFFDPITLIEESKNIVYDFTVPATHSFVSNGFISHNTRISVGDACCVSIPTIYDSTQKNWVTTNQQEPTLFISTELEADEIQTMIMAYVSNVSEEKILDGKYEGDEEERVDKAIEIVTNAPLYIEHVPNFNIDDIERTIKKYKVKHNIGYIFFDYVFTSIKILSEIATKSKGVKLREDNVLIMFVDKMKTLANLLNVHIDTSTQANGDWKNAKDADQNLIRGAKGMADKVDAGYVVLPPTEKDKEAIKPLMQKGFYKEPNLVFHIYKVRRGKINHVRLWTYFGLCPKQVNHSINV